MILRAAFWIVVVAALMPREPDIGFSRPDVGPPGILRDFLQDAALRAKADLKSADAAEHGGGIDAAGGIAAAKRYAQGAAGPLSEMIAHFSHISHTAAAPVTAGIKRYTERAAMPPVAGEIARTAVDTLPQ